MTLGERAVKTMRGIDLEPIGRLEEKVKRLIDAMAALRAEQTRVVDENRRLARELESLTGRLQEAEGSTQEIAVLRDERDQIKQRVSTLLDQLDGLDL